jgi:hypothetical protein
MIRVLLDTDRGGSLILNNLVPWFLNAFSFATRAAAWPCKPPSAVKHIPAHKAP